jgi:START domain
MNLTYFFLLLLPQIAFSKITPDWKKIEIKENVEIYKGEIPGSKVVAFRGTSTIEASMPIVLSVIYDVTRMNEWMSDIEKTSKFEKIEYNRTQAPWPLSDRDFVYETKVNVNKIEKTVEILIESTTHKNAPLVDGVIRGHLHQSRYFLKSIEEGKKTYLEVEILADPKGSVPKWVVNLFQARWPVTTVNGIRKIAMEDGYKIHPDIEEGIKDFSH